MHCLIQDKHGDILAQYVLDDTDPLDCDYYAERFGNSHGVELDGETPGNMIPDGCEDLSVTLLEDPNNPVVIWNSHNYIIKNEEY